MLLSVVQLRTLAMFANFGTQGRRIGAPQSNWAGNRASVNALARRGYLELRYTKGEQLPLFEPDGPPNYARITEAGLKRLAEHIT